MRKTIYNILLFVLLLSLGSAAVSCVEEDDYDDSPSGNFEALWKLMDEHYCFFDYKKDKIGVDWNEVYDKYKSQVNSKMTTKQLFEVCCNMLSELRDGHVNLSASFDIGRNWSYYEDYVVNYNDSIARLYLGTDYGIASALDYKRLDDNVGYVRVESFSDAIGNGNLSDMLGELQLCSGLIIDVRSNGGGELTTAHKLAARFTNEKTLVGYVAHKTGKGHSDFSKPEKMYIEPYDGLRWQKPVVVLANRKSYSATNDFVKCMKTFPNVTVIGDRTGGGSGMPFTQEIPSGWSVRFSAVVLYDKDMNHTEFGIEPDEYVFMTGSDTKNNKDTVIERARSIIAGR
jgi:hypothetical protein